jgi:hypothetical protein
MRKLTAGAGVVYVSPLMRGQNAESTMRVMVEGLAELVLVDLEFKVLNCGLILTFYACSRRSRTYLEAPARFPAQLPIPPPIPPPTRNAVTATRANGIRPIFLLGFDGGGNLAAKACALLSGGTF